MSKISRRASRELKSMGDHDDFLKRIRKTLYYGKLPPTDRLSLPVTELASEWFSEPRTGRSLDRLHCKDAAYISREACISPCTFVLAVVYLERLKACDPEYLQCVAPSHLFLVALMVSSKFLYDNGEDSGVVMSEWAESGGMTVDELISLEKEFLNSIRWDVFVREAMFWRKFDALEETVARRVSKSRGHFTYTELHTLVRRFDARALINALATIVAVLVATYTAGVLTIFGSMYVASQIPGHCLHRAAVPMPEVENDTAVYADNLLLVVDEAKKSSRYVVDVLQTGILLASIQSPATRAANFRDDVSNGGGNGSNSEQITWDWWNSPSMTWLAHASRLVEGLRLFAAATTSGRFAQDCFMDMSIAGAKKVRLEDKLHRGTRVRAQDLLEGSWHAEWTDTIAAYFPYAHITHLFRDVRA